MSKEKNIWLHKAGMLSLSLALISCASNYRRPESIEDKMARFKNKNQNRNLVPEYQSAASPWARGRVPASSSDGGASFDRDLKGKSNKRLYFITLYGQYNTLKKYGSTESAPKVDICPSFHTSMIEHVESYGANAYQKVDWKVSKGYYNSVDKNIASYPELALPITEDSVHPRVYDIISKEEGVQEYGSVKTVVQKAIDIHLTKTYKELTELCEYGTSDNYYSYENLITHIKKNPRAFGPTKSSATTLLKTTVFSNLALIESLDSFTVSKRGRSLASSNENQSLKGPILKRMGAYWAKDYLQYIKQARNK